MLQSCPAEFMRLSAEEKGRLLRNAGLEDKRDIIIEKTAQVCNNRPLVNTMPMLYLDAFPKLGWFPVDCYLSTQLECSSVSLPQGGRGGGESSELDS